MLSYNIIMQSNNFPQTAVALPASVKYDLPPAVPDSCRSYQVSVNPTGPSSITGATQPTTAFVANSAMASAPQFNSQTITIDIPCPSNPNVFLDPRETMLNFRLQWGVTTAAVVAGGQCQLIGSAQSFIDNIVLYSQNNPIEIVSSYNVLSNLLLNSTVNTAERYGGVTVSMGADPNSVTGLDLPFAATGTSLFHFSIPLISIIGLNAGDKLFPIGSINNLQLQITTSSIMPYTTFCTGTTTQPVFAAPILDSWNLNMKYIDVGSEAGAMLRQTLNDGKWMIKASSYTNNNATIPNNTNGSVSLPFQIRNSSVKSVFMQNSIAMSAACPNGVFDGINCAATSLQLSISGIKTPNKPLNPSQKPSECYASLISAFGGLNYKTFGGCQYRGAYGATIPSLPTNSDQMMVVPAAGVRAVSSTDTTTEQIVRFPNMHYLGFDLERISGSLFSGVNTRSTAIFCDMFLGTATTSTITTYCWGLIDVILEIDVAQRTIRAYN